MNINKTTLLLALTAGSALAQPVSIGVKAGVPITDAFETLRGNQAAYFTNTHRYLIGGTVQLNLPLRFAIELDALYKRLGYQYEQSGPLLVSHTVANSWEFPLLGKFAIIGGPLRPFVDAGASLRHISGIEQINRTINAAGQIVDVTVSNATEFNKRNDVGFVFGGGIELKLGRLRITPELRYTRWGSENFRDPVNALLRTSRNQGDFILGLTF
jgi:hypothetical protein